MYYLPKFDDVLQNGFWTIPKCANLGKPIQDIINFPTFIHPFESGNCESESKNYKNLNISGAKRAFSIK